MRKKQIEVDITKINRKGLGTGAYNEKSVSVPFTCPGDRVQAFTLRKKSGSYLCRLDQILTPSSERIEPKCSHFGTCGGCMWQHLSYEAQLLQKEGLIKRLFDPLINHEVKWKSIIPCENPWNYRNKMEFSFSSDAKGESYLGLIIQGSRGHVLNLKECHLVNPWFINALEATRKWWKESNSEAYHPHKNEGTLRTLTVREGTRSGDRLVMLTVSGLPEFALSKEAQKGFVEAINKACGEVSVFLRIHQAIKGQKTQFFEIHLSGPECIREYLEVDGKKQTFHISPSAFFQPNTSQAEKLYQAVLNLCNMSQDAIVYDLYCGTGTLGSCAAQKAKHVYGIELSYESVVDARDNAKQNKIDNITFIQGDVGKILSENHCPKPDIILVDPPRSGLDEKAISHILASNPKTIVYVSCNPLTQAQNIEMLTGYKIVVIQPVDQFPQTAHVENIVILKKESDEIYPS